MKIRKALRALWFYRSCFDEAANVLAVVAAALANKKIDPGEPAKVIAACNALIAAVKQASEKDADAAEKDAGEDET